MGNVELCGGPGAPEDHKLHLVGHMKNSQTRSLLCIIQACNIPYEFDKIECP